MWNEKKRKSHKNIKAKSKLNFSLEKRVDNSSTIVLKTFVEKVLKSLSVITSMKITCRIY